MPALDTFSLYLNNRYVYILGEEGRREGVVEKKKRTTNTQRGFTANFGKLQYRYR